MKCEDSIHIVAANCDLLAISVVNWRLIPILADSDFSFVANSTSNKILTIQVHGAFLGISMIQDTEVKMWNFAFWRLFWPIQQYSTSLGQCWLDWCRWGPPGPNHQFGDRIESSRNNSMNTKTAWVRYLYCAHITSEKMEAYKKFSNLFKTVQLVNCMICLVLQSVLQNMYVLYCHYC